MKRRSPLRFVPSVLLLVVPVMMASSCGILDDDNNGDVSNNNFEAEEPFSFEVEVKDHVRLRLTSVNGVVEITGVAAATSVIVAGERRVGSESLEDAEKHLSDLEVRVADLANEVYVQTIQPQDSHGRNYVVDFTITLPKGLEVDVEHVNGTVDILSINANASVDNVNGNVDLNDVFGSALVNLVNGQIDARVALPENGAVDLSTVNGIIELAIPQSTSASFSAKVSNGAISVSNLDMKDIVSTTTSLQGSLGDKKGSIVLQTVNGNITVRGF